MKKIVTARFGFTLIELMVTILIASIVLLGAGIVLVDAHKGYNDMYSRIYGSVVTEAYISRITFDRVCRKASMSYRDAATEGDTSQQVVYYYSPSNITMADATPIPDRYSRFYTNGGSLLLDDGPAILVGEDLTMGAVSNTITVANNVTSAVFLELSIDNPSLQMILTLDDGSDSLTVTCSSVRHN